MYEAVIFDCDGVLVDSEVLAMEVDLARTSPFQKPQVPDTQR